MQRENNIAYIDGQNLYMGTQSMGTDSWCIDLFRFRVFLRDTYHVETAYYYLSYVQSGSGMEKLYERIQKAGFVLVFRQHNETMLSKKKGNVDTEIIFSIMKRMYYQENFYKVVLVSGDGDYKILADFLIEEKRLAKILCPNRKFASSLYKKLGSEYYDSLDNPDTKRKIKKGS